MKYHIEFDIDLKRNPYKGLYIAFEGIDASGKQTQANRLKKYFEQRGKRVVMASEPQTGVTAGHLIRNILREKTKAPLPALQYLYTANRMANHTYIVLPALERGDVVISHRCFWSAVPYGVLDKMINASGYSFSEKDQILIAQGILSLYHQFIAPDITFYLKISPREAIKRLQKMDRVKEIYEKKEKLAKIAQGYELLIREFPKEFIVIDAEKPAEEVAEEIVKRIKNKNES